MPDTNDNQANPYDATHSEAVAGQLPKYTNYEHVPWYRRSAVNSLFTLLGLLCFSPLLWFVCAMLITGDIYYNAYKEDGSLKTWSAANKVIAWILVFVNLALWGFLLFGGFALA